MGNKNLSPEQVNKLAKKGYDAYRSASGGKSYYTGQPLPEYDTQPEAVKKSWEAAVLSVQPDVEPTAGNANGAATSVLPDNGAACAASPAAAAVDPASAGTAGNGVQTEPCNAPAGAAETVSPSDAAANPNKAAA